jgi:F-type H+/Na+-transporting ATPase subunit alpha
MGSIIRIMGLKMIVKYKKNNMEINRKKIYYTENQAINNIGYVFKVSDDIAYARGLLKVQMSEMVKFFMKDGRPIYGIVNYLDNEGVAGITVLGDCTGITALTIVERVYIQPKIYGGSDVLGRILNPLGEPIDGMGEIKSKEYMNIERNAPSIIARKPVREPLETGKITKGNQEFTNYESVKDFNQSVKNFNDSFK